MEQCSLVYFPPSSTAFSIYFPSATHRVWEPGPDISASVEKLRVLPWKARILILRARFAEEIRGSSIELVIPWAFCHCRCSLQHAARLAILDLVRSLTSPHESGHRAWDPRTGQKYQSRALRGRKSNHSSDVRQFEHGWAQAAQGCILLHFNIQYKETSHQRVNLPLMGWVVYFPSSREV